MVRSLFDKMTAVVDALNINAITAEEAGAMAMLLDERTSSEWRDAAIAVLVDDAAVL